jgi:uncharacterized protein YceK
MRKPWGEPYSGLDYSLERWSEYYHACIFAPPLLLAVIPASAIDIPLSAIADTIILPVDMNIKKASPARIDEDSQRRQHIMVSFDKTEKGGVQQINAGDPNNNQQIVMSRKYLTTISEEFRRGDFSKLENIHGNNPPWLALLRSAKPGDLHIQYQMRPFGAEIRYTSENPVLITAMHQWFDAQLADLGSDTLNRMSYDIRHDLEKLQDMQEQ